MGEKDITEKILEDHNDVFADIINGLIFAGEQRILPESLENTAVHSQYKADDEKVHELERDVTKYWKDQDVQLAICGIENQSSVEKRPFIEKCHCFVLPSWHEGMANTNLECSAMGRPIITSNIHGCLEAVENGVTGYLCEKQNPEDLYRIMKKICELSYEERKAMGLAGRKRMEDIFDKKKVVSDTIEVLKK